jgi:hypothetical protein
MQLLHEAEAVLKAAGYRTARNLEDAASVIFEDATLLGFVSVHDSAQDIIDSWRERQDRFLRRNAAQLRKDPSKAWSIYSAFLTAELVDEHAWSLLGIEADIHATRKIVRGGIITRADIYGALAPLLPLGVRVLPERESADRLLEAKLTNEERQLFELMSTSGADDQRLVAWLVEGAP